MDNSDLLLDKNPGQIVVPFLSNCFTMCAYNWLKSGLEDL